MRGGTKTGESYATARSMLLAGDPGATADDSPLDWMPGALHISNGDAERAGTMRQFSERDQAVEDNRDGQYVLWFEADLYDQLQITEILARLAGLGVPAEHHLDLHRRTRRNHYGVKSFAVSCADLPDLA